MTGRLRVAALLLTGTVACDNAGSDRVLSIEATGLVRGLVYLDQNGSGRLDGGDTPLPGVRVRLVARGTRDTVGAGVSGPDGTYSFGQVSVANYRVVVDSSSVGDTLRVVRIDTSEVSLEPNDSVRVEIGVSYPRLTVRQARAATLGSRFFVEGYASTSQDAFGDTTAHFADTSGAIRVTRIRRTGATFFAGDSVRLLGRANVRDGQRTLDDATAFFIGLASPPPAPLISTAQAATALGGTLDAALVRLQGADITDTVTVRGDYRLTVDDGSGPLIVVLDQDVAITKTPYVPGVAIDVAGVLVPDAGTWQLKPRGRTDIVRN